MVKPKVEGYQRQPDLQTITMQYNSRNSLPIYSAQIPHAQQWTVSIL